MLVDKMNAVRLILAQHGSELGIVTGLSTRSCGVVFECWSGHFGFWLMVCCVCYWLEGREGGKERGRERRMQRLDSFTLFFT